MTNLILSFIGILLAAVATVLAIDYGGDYYLDAGIDAQTTEIENALDQVAVAHQVYESQTMTKATNLSQLVSAGMLAQVPNISNGAMDAGFLDIRLNGKTWKAVRAYGIPQAVCARINERSGFVTNWGDGQPSDVTVMAGCYTTTVNGSGFAFRLVRKAP